METTMKTKAILFNKLAHQAGRKTRKIIGLVGTHHGTGVTHTGLLLAFYLGEELGKRTALLECNGHGDMGLIREAYQWNSEAEEGFAYHRISCYQEVVPGQLVRLLGGDYEYVLLDFGTDLMKNREELLRCSIRIAVGGPSAWDLQKLGCFMESLDDIGGRDSWLYFIPRGRKEMIQKLQKKMKQRIWEVPESPDPTRISRDVKLFMERCFHFR